MRVHLVSEHASPLALLGGIDAGGQNVHVAALAEGLAALGDEVVVHTRRDDPSLPRRVQFCDGVTVDHVDAGPPEPISKDELLPYMGEFADDLERSWVRQRPDVAHAHFWMSGLAALDAADRVHVPVALTYHALGSEKRRHQGADDTSPLERLRIEPWLARSVDRVIATTATERQTLIGMGAAPERVDVIPCGVDLCQFDPSGPIWPQPSWRARVVSVSRLVQRKGLADVVEAVAGLPNVELLIAGGPPAAMLGDDAYARHLDALAAELGAADRVRLLGAVERHDMPGLLRSASVVCCTPWYEPFGLVAVEAMACGVPVIATRVGGLAETVVDEITGLHVPPRRPNAVREAIRSLMQRPSLRSSMADASIERAQRFGWGHVARHTHRTLSDLAANGPDRQPGGADARTGVRR